MGVNIDNIFFLADDQAKSQYSLIFPEGIPGGGNAERISLRMNKEFQMPEMTWYTYKIYDHGFYVPKKGMLQEVDKESLQVQVRIDQQWAVFDDLWNWAQLSYNQNNGEGGGDAEFRTSLIVQAEDTKQKAVKRFRFKGVGIKGFNIDAFNMEEGDPMYVTLTLIWNEMIPEKVQ